MVWVPPLGPTDVTSTLCFVFLVDFAIQFVFYVISAIWKTEKFYDLSGSITFILCTILALLIRNQDDPIASLSFRQILACILVLLWTIRLGIFLFIRVLTVEDKRFDELKNNPFLFAVPFFIQVMWIYITALPLFIVLGNPSSSQRGWMWSDYLGLVVWIFGFMIELIADSQKQSFKKIHPNDFVNVGIWKL